MCIRDRYAIPPDPLSQRLYHYRLKAFQAGCILAQAEENPQSYVHLFRVNYVVRGEALFLIDDQAFPVHAGHAVIIPPRGILTQANPKEEVETYFINFDVSNLTMRDEFMTRLLEWFPFYQVRDNERQILRYLFCLLYTSFRIGHRQRQDKFTVILIGLLVVGMIHQIFHRAGIDPAEAVFSDIRERFHRFPILLVKLGETVDQRRNLAHIH